MRYHCAIFLGIIGLAAFQVQAEAASILGTADSFSVLGGSTVTNTGPSVLTGDLGVSPGSAITGFPPGVVVGTIYAGGPVATQAQADNSNAYNSLVKLSSNVNLTGQDLGGLTLTPGVYSFSSSAQLTGKLTLDNSGDPNGLFVFQIGSTLTTASNASIVTSDGLDIANLFFQVGSSATLGTGTQFRGNILAFSSITLNSGANISCGRALAQNGAVTLDTNVVSNAGCTGAGAVPAIPEPNFLFPVLGFGLVGLLFVSTKRVQNLQ